MTEHPHELVRRLFDLALETPAQDRDSVLEQACAGDEGLKARILAMVRASEDDQFLGDPTVDAPPPLPAPSDRSVPREAVGQTIGRYKLLEEIGEGGFGSVWAAEQREPVKRRVALKLVKLGMDTQQVIARFEAERQALAMMDHPNIAKVLDAGATDTGRPFFVMELVRGVPILDYCDTEKLDTKTRLILFAQVCQAIQHAHQKGIIHRDIKPSNVLITLHDGVPVPKVIDFGIAKATSQKLTDKTIYTQHRQMVGTPLYMSPEQAEMSGLDIDTRSDIYSLGVLLYEMLTGTTPFTSEQLSDAGLEGMMRLIREVKPHKPSTRLSSLGATATRTAEQRRADIRKLGLLLKGDLDWIVMKCLEKDRTRRYETASGLAADISRHLSDEPVLASPPSTSYRFRKFVRRNRGQVIATSIVLFALLLGIAGTSTGLLWALSEKERAELAEADAEARAGELEKVATFQSKQLSSIHPHLMGADLRRALLEEVPEEDRVQLETLLKTINLTDIALDLLEGNLFEQTIDAIETQFSNQPLVRARLLQTIAATLRDLGLLELAQKPQDQALEIRRREYGDQHERTLDTLGHLVVLQMHRQDLEAAERSARELLESSQSVLGDEHPMTVNALGRVGTILSQLGKDSEAETYMRQAMAGARQAFGESHERYLRALSELGTLLLRKGKFEEAGTHLRSSLEGHRDIHGSDHTATLDAMNQMGQWFASQGKDQEAKPYYLEVLSSRRRMLGDDHPMTLAVMANLGGLLARQSEYEQSEQYLTEALEGYRRVFGEDNQFTLGCINTLGFLFWRQHRDSEAEPHFRAALAGNRRVFGDSHPSTLLTLNNLGSLFLQQQRYEDAEPFALEAWQGAQRVMGKTHPHTLIFMTNWGKVLRGLGRLDEAESCLCQAAEGLKGALGDNLETASALEFCGKVLESLGRLDEAEQYFREACQVSIRTIGDEHPRALDALNDLGRFLQSRGKLDEAESLLQKALEVRRRVQGDEHMHTVISMANYSLLLADLQRGDEALELVDEALSTVQRLGKDDNPIGGNLLGKRGRALQALKRYDEAAEVMRLAHEKLTAAYGLEHEQTQRVVGLLVELYTVWDAEVPGAGHERSAESWRTKLTP